MVYLSAGALTVRYSKLGDRLSHTIGIQDGDTYLPLLESIEGSPEEPWPASPPMQQMVAESLTPGARPVLLGVGLSGNGHWSTAIETLNSRILKFDIACKITKSAHSMGSEYRVASPTELGPRSDSIALLPESIPRIEIVVSIGQLEFFEIERRIRIVPKSNPSSIQTHRWCYEIRLSS